MALAKSAQGPDAGRVDPARAQKLQRKAPRSGASQADRYTVMSLLATGLGWLCVLLGQRVLDTQQGVSNGLTGLGVLLLVASLGQRLWALSTAGADRRGAARAFALLSGLGVVALAAYFATTTWGRAALGVAQPALGKDDNFGDFVTVFWVSLVLLSVLSTVLGELARLAMLRAERMESGRVLAAVVAGAALSMAAVYGSLFTYAAGKLKVSADFSYFRVAKPSDATRRMIDSLDDPVKVLAFFPEHSEVRGKVVRYLTDLGKGSNNLQLEVHERLMVPELAKEYKVTRDGVLVLVRGKTSKKLEIGSDIKIAARKLKTLDGEFQKALMKAMRDKRTVYLTVGHGELNESSDQKAGRTTKLLRQLVEQQNYGIKDLGLAQGLGKEIPQDAAVVFVLGPSEAFTDAEVETLRDYAEGGGSLLLALDPEGKGDHSALAALAGLAWQPGLVVNDRVLVRATHSQADKKFIVSNRFSSHASVSTLSKISSRAAVVLPGAAALDKLPDESDKALKIDFTVKSQPGSYRDLNGNWAFDKDSEKKATFNLAAAVSKKLGAPQAGTPHELRVFAIADADVFSDMLLSQAKYNQLLLAEALRWLGYEESFTGEIESTEDVAIVQTKAEDQIWFYLSILGFPSLVLGLGLVFTRRSRRPKKAAARLRSTADEPATAASSTAVDKEDA